MVFFLPAFIAAAVGVGLAGYGIWKGGSDVGSAARRVSESTDSMLMGFNIKRCHTIESICRRLSKTHARRGN